MAANHESDAAQAAPPAQTRRDNRYVGSLKHFVVDSGACSLFAVATYVISKVAMTTVLPSSGLEDIVSGAAAGAVLGLSSALSKNPVVNSVGPAVGVGLIGYSLASYVSQLDPSVIPRDFRPAFEYVAKLVKDDANKVLAAAASAGAMLSYRLLRYNGPLPDVISTFGLPVAAYVASKAVLGFFATDPATEKGIDETVLQPGARFFAGYLAYDEGVKREKNISDSKSFVPLLATPLMGWGAYCAADGLSNLDPNNSLSVLRGAIDWAKSDVPYHIGKVGDVAVNVSHKVVAGVAPAFLCGTYSLFNNYLSRRRAPAG